jgi:hypothetical protein
MLDHSAVRDIKRPIAAYGTLPVSNIRSRRRDDRHGNGLDSAGTQLGVPGRVHGRRQALGRLWSDPCAAGHRPILGTLNLERANRRPTWGPLNERWAGLFGQATRIARKRANSNIIDVDGCAQRQSGPAWIGP